jgi:LysM repeat protein
MKRVGLFVGIDKYENNIQPLRFACLDARALHKVFRKRFDVVTELLNDEATSDDILKKVQQMTENLNPGDLFVFYFAGHGREIDGVHNLVGINGWSDPVYTQGLATIPQLLHASAVPGLNRLFILDCCRVDLLAGRSGVYACPTSRDLSLKNALLAPQGENVLPPFILNSCSSGQRAFESLKKKHGVFSLALKTILIDTANPVRDFSTLLKRVDEKMKDFIPPGAVQTLDQSCNPSQWSNVPLFADWEKRAAEHKTAPAQTAEASEEGPQKSGNEHVLPRGKEKSIPRKIVDKILLAAVVIAAIYGYSFIHARWSKSPIAENAGNSPAAAITPAPSAPSPQSAPVKSEYPQMEENSTKATTVVTESASSEKAAPPPPKTRSMAEEHEQLAHKLFEKGRKELEAKNTQEALKYFREIKKLEFVPKKFFDQADSYIKAIIFEDKNVEVITPKSTEQSPPAEFPYKDLPKDYPMDKDNGVLRIQTPKEISSSSDLLKYTVQSGDNPERIARRHRVRLSDLLKINNLNEEQAKNLKVGQVLYIPRKKKRSGKAPAEPTIRPRQPVKSE